MAEKPASAAAVKPKRLLAAFNALLMLPRTRAEVLGASLVINILSLALPLVVLQTYDRILPNQSFDTLSVLVIGVAVAFAIDGVLRFSRAQVTGWAGARFDHLAGVEAVSRLLDSRVAAYERNPPGVHLERVSALDTLRDFFSGQAMMALIDLPFAILFLAIIAYLAGYLALVPVVLVLFFAFRAWRMGTRLRSGLKGQSGADDDRFSFIINVLGGVHTAKSFGMEALLTRRYEHLLERGVESGYEVNYLGGNIQSLGATFSQITTVLVAAVGSTYVINQELSVGGLVACTLLAGRSLQPLLGAMGVWTQFQGIRVAAERIGRTLVMETERGGAAPPERLRGEIVLEGVTFGYRDDRPPLLSEADFRAAPGEIVAVVGDNGSGKSSLLWIIMGMYRPQGGRVLIDGHDLAQLHVPSARKQIAYVPQQGTLFEGTILQNITGFQEDADPAGASAKAQAVGLDRVVAQMPLGYQTVVGAGNADIVPPGVAQRIVIARALYADCSILLFDDADRNIDAAGDANIAHAIAGLKGHVTVVLVSRRPSLLRLADRSYVLKDGRLTEKRVQVSRQIKSNVKK